MRDLKSASPDLPYKGLAILQTSPIQTWSPANILCSSTGGCEPSRKGSSVIPHAKRIVLVDHAAYTPQMVLARIELDKRDSIFAPSNAQAIIP
jgi:hypothetical protein